MLQPCNVVHADRVATFAFPFEALVDGEVEVCIVQTTPVREEDITGDLGRPGTARVLAQLLEPAAPDAEATGLDALLPGRRATLVLAPEYALGSPDWEAVDAAVRACPRDLLLIAGFGATPGARLAAWLREAGATARSGTWGPGVIGPAHVYNGGWLWIHRPGIGTHCVCFLKTFLQQRDEAALPGMGRGTAILHVRLDDLDLFPLLCAELLQAGGAGVSTALRRVGRALDREGAPGRPALVTASLLQDPPHNVNWCQAISAAVGLSDTRPVRLLIANQGCGRPCAEEDHDRWRSLSGAYAGFSAFPKGHRAFPGARPLALPGVFQGMVVRDSEPALALGALSFRPASVVTGLDLWRVQGTVPLGTDGLRPPRACDATVCGHELHRLTLRCPGDDEWGVALREGLARVRHHLLQAGVPDAASLLSSLLGGTSGVAVDGDAFHPVLEPLTAALHALATLTCLGALSWHGRDDHEGQLSFDEAEAHVLVWNDPARSGAQMIRMLEAWAMETGSVRRLLVFGSGFRVPLREGPVRGDRRTDLTAPPAGDEDGWGPCASGGADISVPRIRRAVACVGLHRIAEVYIDGDRSAEEAAALLAEVLRLGREGLAA